MTTTDTWPTDSQLDAATWRDIPVGHYAVEMNDWDREPSHLGWLLFRVQRNLLSTRYSWAADVTPEDIQVAKRCWVDPDLEVRYLATMEEKRRQAQVDFAALTGRCASCNREITNPASILHGRGPECRRRGPKWDKAHGL